MHSGGGDDGLLLESRRLLNALNEENSDLKESHYQLESRLREEEDAHSRSKRLMQSEQKDSKQINFNLMSQLKAKTNRVKELEAQLDEVVATDRSKAREAVRSQSAASDLQAEVSSLQEHLRIAEERNQVLNRQLGDSESQASKFSTELQRAVAAHRDDQLHQQQDFNVTTVQLREEVGNLQEKLTAAESRASKAEDSLSTIKERHAAECQALVEEARRNAQVESDALFAHDQMHHIASMVHQNLADLQTKVRVCASECEENDAQLHHLMQRCQEESAAIRAVHHCDTSIVKAVSDQHLVFETKLKDTLRDLEAAKFAKAESEGKVLHLRAAVDDIGREVADMERQLHGTALETKELKQQNATLSAKLQHLEKDASSVAEKSTGLRIQVTESQSQNNMAQERIRLLELELSKERGSYAAQLSRAQQIENELRNALREEEEKYDLTQQQYEEELTVVRGQLQDHTTVLSSALGRLQQPGGSTPGVGARSSSAMMLATPGSGTTGGHRQPSRSIGRSSLSQVRDPPGHHHGSTAYAAPGGHPPRQSYQNPYASESGFLQTNQSSIHGQTPVAARQPLAPEHQVHVASPKRAPPQPSQEVAISPNPHRQHQQPRQHHSTATESVQSSHPYQSGSDDFDTKPPSPTQSQHHSTRHPSSSPGDRSMGGGDPLENQLVAALKRLNA